MRETADRAIRYLRAIDERSVVPRSDADLLALSPGLPEGPTEPGVVLELLDRVVSPATMAMAGPRFFGWVIGGAHPAALAADWLTTAWDQNTVFAAATPGTVAVENAALRWVIELAGLPEGCWGSFVTGTTAANAGAMAAAANSVLAEVGWDAVSDGLFGAPPVTVVIGEEAHPSLIKALGLTGLGRHRVLKVPVDDQGRMRANALPSIEPPAIVCVQAGNVNTGAFDPMSEIVPAAKEMGAWVHVDGAFGFWAAASPVSSPLTTGMEHADSWATDAHKYLNVPYDAGILLVRKPSSLERVTSVSASYLPEGQIGQDPLLYTPEMSRRARGVPTWAMLMTLGRSGVAELIERTCRLARRFADRLAGEGYEILNDVVLNQVLVSFGEDITPQVVAASQADGTMFAGPTVWQGKQAMRISVSSWKTTDEDVDRSVEAILRCVQEVKRRPAPRITSPPSADTAVVIDERFSGPPGSGNGGYVAGILARQLAGPAEVTLRRPPPIDHPLLLSPTEAGTVVLLDGQHLVAEARAVDPQIDPLQPISPIDAARAAQNSSASNGHPYPRCFVCGPLRRDGLRIFPGHLPGSDLVAAPWTPDRTLAGDDHLVRPEFIWASLDCAGAFASGFPRIPMVLGRLTAKIDRAVEPGRDYVVVGRCEGSTGRKHTANTALFDAEGALHAAARAVWFESAPQVTSSE